MADSKREPGKETLNRRAFIASAAITAAAVGLSDAALATPAIAQGGGGATGAAPGC